MARNAETDPIRCFRFGVSFDDQLPMGFMTVEIRPTTGPEGSGRVCMKTAFTPLIVDFLKQKKRSSLDILAYRIEDDWSLKGRPSLTFRLHGVKPSAAVLKPVKWDASSDEILYCEFDLGYTRLEMIQGGDALLRPRPRPRARPKQVVFM